MTNWQKVWRSICWDSRCSGIQSVRKKTFTLPNEGLKSPGRKCSHEGQQVHRNEATLRVKPSPVFSSSAFTSKPDPFLRWLPLPAPNPLCLGLSLLEEKHHHPSASPKSNRGCSLEGLTLLDLPGLNLPEFLWLNWTSYWQPFLTAAYNRLHFWALADWPVSPRPAE